MKELFLKHKELLFILVVCATLRFLPLFDYQFTYDELSGLERTQFTNFSDLINKGVKIDAHPAFVQLLIFALVKLFGYVTWIIKLPFLLFGFGAIVYGYALGYKNFSKQAGLVMALFLSFSLVFVFYAPIARMYISGVFFSLGLLYYFFDIVFLKQTQTKNYVLFGLFALLSATNQHLNALFAFTVYLSGFVLLEKAALKKYLVCGLLTALAYLPNLPVTLYQFGLAGIGREQGGWLEAPEWYAVFSFITVLMGTGLAGFVLLLLLLLPGLTKLKMLFGKKQVFLLTVFVLNYLIIYFYSVYRAPVYQNSVMLFSGTAFLLFVASMFYHPQLKRANIVLVLIGFILINKTYNSKDYFHQAVKTVYEYQFERTMVYKKMLGDKKVYPLFFDVDSIMRKIYFKKYNTAFECKLSTDSVFSSMALYSKFVSQLKCDYLVLSSSMPAQQAVAKLYFPYLIENTQTQGIHYKVYARYLNQKELLAKDDRQLIVSSPKVPGTLIYAKPLQKSLLVDSLTEFPYDAKGKYHDLIKKEGNVLQLFVRIKGVKNNTQQVEACLHTEGNDDKNFYGYAARPAKDFVMSSDSTNSIYTDYFAGTAHSKMKRDATLAAYIWNRGKENLLLQDFEVRVIDHWPQKWQFWN